MPDVTVIIPTAPYHEQIVPRAIQSAETQSVPVKVLWGIDKNSKGPGYVRNRLLEQVATEYVVFLDADDWLEPTFAAECLNAIQPGRYVYTDWYEDDKYIQGPDRPYCKQGTIPGQWHVITCMVRMSDVIQAGMFDETLIANEDMDFWLKLQTINVCGLRVPKALSHYSIDGQRSKTAKAQGVLYETRDKLLERYPLVMACCGKQGVVSTAPIGERQPNDRLAQAQWGGNRREYGRHTQRFYPRMSYPAKTWVDPGDIAMSPNLWKEVIEPPVGGNGPKQGIEAFDQFFHKPLHIEKETYAVPPGEPPIFSPNVQQIVDIAQERLT